MDLETLFRWTRPVRGLPVSARYILAALIVLVSFALSVSVAELIGNYPFLLFFPAVIFISLVLDRGTGAFSVLLSTGLTWFFLLPPHNSFAIHGAAHFASLVIYVLVGLFLAGVIEALRVTANSVHESKLELERAAELNRLLLIDLNHRMKNHLLSATSLLRLSMRGVSDDAARGAMEQAAGRIDILGKVYDRLHLGDDATIVSSRDFITALVDDLRAGVIGVRPVVLRCQAEDVELSSGQAVAVGLIINEAVENALKHAFPDERPGEIAVRFENGGATCRLSVTDDGVGLPPDRKTGGGSRLTRSLAQQLGGELRMLGPPGVCATLTFPTAPPAP
jgi:two-component sensor histidine kinase